MLLVAPRIGTKGHRRNPQHRDLSQQAPAASTALNRICQATTEQELGGGTSGNSLRLASKVLPGKAAQIPRNHRHNHA